MAASPIISMTFYTHGGFDLVQKVWNYVALLTNSAEYKSLIVIVFLMSFFFSAMAGSFRGLLDGRSSPSSWLASAAAAIIMFSFFFTGPDWQQWALKGRIVVYDDVLNKQTYVDNLPPGLVLIAGIMSELQHALEHAIIKNYSISGADTPYELVMQTKIIKDIHSREIRNIVFSALPLPLQMSIYNYINDVASVEMAAKANLAQELFNNSTDLITTMNNLANPVLVTTVYLDANGNPLNTAVGVTGSEAWNRIQKAITSSTSVWNNIRDAICTRFGFDMTTASVTDCEEMLSGFMEDFKGITMTSSQVLQNLAIANVWYRWMQGVDPFGAGLATSTISTRASGFMSGLSAAAEAMPHIMIVFSALLVAISPLILLIIVSTQWYSGVTTLIGLWGWYLCWVVVDTTLLTMWCDYALHFAQKTTGYGSVGLNSLLNLTAIGSQTLAVLGGYRFAGLTLSSMLCYALFKFGGAALAHVAGSITAQVKGGVEAGASAITPERRLQAEMANMAASMPSWTAANEFNPMELYVGSLGNTMRTVAQGQAALKAGNAPVLTEAFTNQLMETIGKYTNMTSSQAFQKGMVDAWKGVGESQGFIKLADYIRHNKTMLEALGFSKEQIAHFENISNQEIFDRLYTSAAYSFGAENTGKFMTLVKEGKLDYATLEKMTAYSSSINALENYLKEDFAKDLKENPFMAAKKLAGLLTEVKQAQLGLTAEKGKLGHEFLEKTEGFNWANPVAKGLQRMLIMDKLDDGKISENMQEFLRNFKKFGKDFFGGDINTIMGHFSNFEFTVQNQDEARILSDALKINVKEGDQLRFDYNLTKDADGNYDMQITHVQENLNKTHRLRIGNGVYNVQGTKLEELGSGREKSIVLKGGHMKVGNSVVNLDQVKQEVVGGKYVLQRFQGSFTGSSKDLEELLKSQGWFDQVKTNSKAWEKLKAAADSGKAIHLNYDNGNFTLGIKSETGYEKIGTFAVKRTEDTLDTVQAGRMERYVDRREMDLLHGYTGDLSAQAYYSGEYTGKAYKISMIASEDEAFDKTTSLQDAQWMSRQLDSSMVVSKVTGWGLNLVFFKMGETKSQQIATHLHVNMLDYLRRVAKSEAATEAERYAKEHGISKEEAFRELYARKRWELFNDYYRLMYHMSQHAGGWKKTIEWAKKAGISHFVIDKLQEVREEMSNVDVKSVAKTIKDVAMKPLQSDPGAITVVGLIMDKLDSLFHHDKHHK